MVSVHMVHVTQLGETNQFIGVLDFPQDDFYGFTLNKENLILYHPTLGNQVYDVSKETIKYRCNEDLLKIIRKMINGGKPGKTKGPGWKQIPS